MTPPKTASPPKPVDIERQAVPETDVPTSLVFVEAPAAPDHVNMVLYGPTGSGKSTAAATAPGPFLWVNADGPNALAYARKTARERDQAIFEVRVEPGMDVQTELRNVARHVRDGAVPQVETVVVDTVAKVREALAAQLVQPGAKNSFQQWGDVAKALGGFVRVMRDLPVNLILLCHEDVSDVEGDRIVRPLIGGALSETVPGEVDVVAYCGAHREDDQVRYLGQLVEGRGRRAKDRSGGLGAVRVLDLSEWIVCYRQALAGDLPWETAA